MKFCPNCRAELKPEAKFCIACGTPIVATSATPVEPTTSQPQPYYQQAEPVYEQAREATNAFSDAITGKTNLVQRVIKILTKPKEEWQVIATEKPEAMKLIGGYALILALIPAVSAFIHYGIIGTTENMGFSDRSISTGLIEGLTQLFSTVIAIYLLSYIIDWLAPSFESEKNFGKSLQLAVYSNTAMWVSGILIIIPGLRLISILAGLIYSIYLFTNGLPVLKGTNKDKVAGYTALTIIAMIIILSVMEFIFGNIIELFTS